MERNTDRIGYMHLRRRSLTVEPSGLRISTNNPTGGLTVAYLFRPNGVIEYGIARCHPDEHYDKAVGRHIALTRLVNEPITTYLVRTFTLDRRTAYLRERIMQFGLYRSNLYPLVQSAGWL